jgi:peptide/nickel transport system substrate-binding protein
MKRQGLLVSIIMVASLLVSCATPTPEIVEKVVTQVVTQVVKETVVQKEVVQETVIVEGTPQIVEKEVTKIVEVEKVVTPVPEPEPEPAVGGTLVIARPSEPPTLDPHLAVGAAGELTYIGATLVARDLEGNFIPYLAESWEVSEDGLTWDFKLRQDVKFHDGTPLTAHDYAWTFQRVLDPETGATAAASALGPLVGAEAVDDYTLRLSLAIPYYSILASLDLAFLQPLSQAAVEQWGDQYGRHPVGVGPYKLKEWITGEKIILERNPDFNWGPDFVHEGPPYIETLEFRVIPEASTIIAGLETGEIDHWVGVPIKDIARIRDTGQFYISEGLVQGMYPGLFPNVTQPPFDDIKVRQAFSLAVDRESLVKVILGEGNGVPQYGPISSSVSGYWAGVEYIGYHYNLDKARALMQEAGYTYNDDGMLEKDGEPLKVEISFTPEFAPPGVAEVLQQQYKALGVDAELGQYEWGVLINLGMTGQMALGLAGYDFHEVDVLVIFFHSSGIGGMNFSYFADPKMDAILEATRATMDPEKRQEWANEAQRYLVEQAVVIPLYAAKEYAVLSNRVMGDVTVIPVNSFVLNDAYLVTQ